MWFRVGMENCHNPNSTKTQLNLTQQKLGLADATEDVQNSSNLGISYCDKRFLTVALNSFLRQEVSFCDKKFLSVT